MTRVAIAGWALLATGGYLLLSVAPAAATGVAAAGASTSKSAGAPSTSESASAAPSSSAATSSASASPTAACPASTQVSLSGVSLTGGTVTITFTDNGTACPAAAPVKLHVHQNLLSARAAGSDNTHQANNDFWVGPNSTGSVSVPALSSVPGKCWLQVDVHVNEARRGAFFALPGCTSASPSQSTSASHSTTPPSPSTSTSPSFSQSVEASSSTRPVTQPAVVVAATGISSYPAVHVATGIDQGSNRPALWWPLAAAVAAGTAVLVWLRTPRRRGSYQ